LGSYICNKRYEEDHIFIIREFKSPIIELISFLNINKSFVQSQKHTV